MVKFLTGIYLVLMSCIGLMYAVALLCHQIGIVGYMAASAVLIAGVLNCFIAIDFSIDNGSKDAIGVQLCF